METLRVRMYNVRFGDAILVSVPDRDPATGETVVRHVLVDVGNVLAGEGGEDTVFQPVLEDVLSVLGGQPLDLYVMTHEHLDHVQGLLYANDACYGGALKERLKVRHSWLTASAAPDYYERHPDAERQLQARRALYDTIARYCELSPASASGAVPVFLRNNDYRRTGRCVEYLRGLADRTHYVHRELPLEGTHPFKEARLEVWAPEEDTATYSGPFLPLALGLEEGGLHVPVPPAGVDASAFYGLIARRRQALGDNLLSIDKAANNTSLVFSLEWRGWRLLFAGDAELRSWKTMKKHGVLKPVHFLKVSHHGSHNGTPDGDLFDAVLPPHPLDDRERRAVISSHGGTYGGIPHEPTNLRLRSRCALSTTLDAGDRPYLDFLFEEVAAGQRVKPAPRVARPQRSSSGTLRAPRVQSAAQVRRPPRGGGRRKRRT
ncbi:MAG TPA: hypothetical protein VE153_35515 [Myxococcus sp.]|nr:hypothetical protein [Myxococcus sp.]